MKTVKAFIEIGDDRTYNVYPDLEDDYLNYGIFGEGNTVTEAIEDFLIGYEDMKKFHKEDGKYFAEAEFVFKYDVASFLSFYSKYLNLAGLSRLTGMNQSLLSHYLNGVKKPSEKTIRKIEKSINDFGTELSQLRFS